VELGKNVLLSVLLLTAALVWAKEYDVIFEYKPPYKAGVVYVTGDFANWNATAYKMTYFEAEDIWRKTLKLKEGKYLYKFVINGSDWKPDPQNPDKVADGYGSFNSVLVVGSAYKLKFNEKTGDGKIAEAGLGFYTDDIKFFDPYLKNRIRFIVRAAANDVEKVSLLIGGAKKDKYAMLRISSDSRFDYWVAYVKTTGKQIKFYFSVKDGAAVKFLGENGVSNELKNVKKFFLSDAFKNMLRTPDWAKNVVWYQIMVDRFRNGSKENDPPGILPFTWDWFKKTEKEKREGFYKAVWDRKFGGDLIGVRQKLGYFRDLGVTAIYFNPVFESESYQKYNTDNYIHIDDNFYEKGDISKISGELEENPGTWQWTPTDRYFLNFVAAAHKKNLRVIIDGVFNHSGERFPPFVDLKKNGRKSKYKDWYVVTDWNTFEKFANQGKGYVGWAGFGGLPEFNEDENGLVQPVRNYFFNITKRWLLPGGNFAGIDGWRLDVPMCVKKPFWEEWRKVVKKSKPSAYTVGEIWTDASSWLNEGKTFDAAMNYELAKIIVKFFIDRNTKISASEFSRRIRALSILYPYQIALVQYNLTNSHDTDRIASMIKNPDRVYNTRNRLQNSDGANYDNSRPTKDDYRILKLIWTFLFAYPGSPAIYYGDEVGMWGADDPNNRKPMWWEDLMPYENSQYRINRDLKNYVRKLIAARNTYPALRVGEFYPELCDDAKDVVAFKRVLDGEAVYVLINNSSEKRIVEVSSSEALWNTLKGGIKKVNKSNYIKNGPTEKEGAAVFFGDFAKVNCVSLAGKADYFPRNGKITVTLKPKSGIYLVNRAYKFR